MAIIVHQLTNRRTYKDAYLEWLRTAVKAYRQGQQDFYSITPNGIFFWLISASCNPFHSQEFR